MPGRAKDLARIVGRRIRELRQQRGWAQVDLVAHMEEHVTQAAISGFENAKHAPSFETLAALAEAFEVRPAALFLSPEHDLRDRVAATVLGAPEKEVEAAAKLLGIEKPRRKPPSPTRR